MKRIAVILFVVFFTVLMLACEKEKPEGGDVILKSGELLLGSWIHPQYEDTIVIYTRSVGLDEDGYSFTFDFDNKFIERKNAGWCGTPPITYNNFEGTWVQQSDSILSITTGYWGGTVDYQWKILKLNTSTLKVVLLKQDYHNDF